MEIDLGQKYLQPIQQLALHKQPYNINGVEFFCQQSYYQGQLLNGVDLNIKQIKGLSANPNLIDYLPDSQQIIFSASSSLVVYNTHKKTYHQLLNLTGNILIVKVLFDKTNNREYVIWVEKQFIIREDPEIQFKETLKKTNHVTLKKQQTLKQQSKHHQNDFFQNMLGTFINENNTPGVNLNEGIVNPKEKKVKFESNFLYSLKVYDYSKKQVFFNKTIDVAQNQTIKQVFLFYGELKVAGYIIQSPEKSERQIFFTKFQKNQLTGTDHENNFSVIETSLKIQNLKFNNQQSTYVFHDKDCLYRFYPQEQNLQSRTLNSFEQFLNMSHSPLMPKSRPLQMIIEQYVKFEGQILSITISDYLAVLLSNRIYFHSAFQMQSLIFIHQIEQKELVPSVIQFNKSTLLLTYKNSSKLTTYALKNKSLKVFSITTLQIQHCQQILKIFCNNLSSQIFCVILFYELQSRYNIKSTDKPQETVLQYITKPAFIDISRSFLSPSSKTESKILHVAKQKFKKIHTCAWLSKYIIETQSSIYFGDWRQNFDNKKCICLHPTGIFLVICFKQSFKIYIITFQGLVNTYRGDSINDIQACTISSQGNHLAIGSANLITIYDFYSCTKIKFINLPIGTYIDSMEYMAFQLCCSFRSKKFYIYDSMNSYKELVTFNPKTFISDQSNEDQVNIAYNITYQLFNLISIYSVFYDPNMQLILFSAKNNLYFYNCLTNLIMLNIQMDNITYFHYCPNLKTLFLGTQHGQILSFAWPNKPINLAKNDKRLKLHGGNITSISVSSDLKYLITIGEDNSLCICYLTFVQNLKRIEGLQLIQYLFNSIHISFDILSRKGFYQFTHSKYNEKMDLLKDYEDQNLNINFILPEERTKQKQQMITNINDTTIELINTNDVKYEEISKLVNEAKIQVSKIKQDLRQTEMKKERQINSLKKDLFADYLAQYDTTQANQRLLEELKIKFRQEIKKQYKKCQNQLENEKASYRRELIKLENKFKSEQKQLPPFFGQQLQLIQQQKQQFIYQNIDCLSNIINDYQEKNGTLACKNNNIQKEMLLLKKKMEEHNFLLHRLQRATNILTKEQQQYRYCKSQKQQRLQKQDKINLTEIQKEYVRQTQVLIEKDKEISILIENYQKQKNTLIYLEKCVEALENSIEKVVQNILIQKKQRKELIQKIDQSGNLIKNNTNRVIEQKKEKVLIKNTVNGFIHNLASVANQVISKTQDNVIELLQKNKLLIVEDIIIPDKKQEQKQMLQKIIEAKLNAIGDVNQRNVNVRLSEPKIKKYFKSRTQGKQDVYSLSHRFMLKNQTTSETSRFGIQNKRRKVILLQKSEKKIYQRIKTDQVVYQNRINKRNLQNQDLLQSYNTLAMDLYKTCSSLKRQQSLNRITIKKINCNKGVEIPLTPYQKYIQNKIKQQTDRKHKINGQVFQL